MPTDYLPVKCVILCAGAGVGGTERIVQTLARQYLKRGISNHVVLPDDPHAPETAEWLAKAGVMSEISPALRHAFQTRDRHSGTQLTDYLREHPSEVVNLHYCLNHVPLRDVIAVRRTGRRCVVSLHLGRVLDPSFQRKEIWDTRRAVELCEAVVVISGFQKRFLVEAGIRADRIHVIPGGVAIPRVPPQQADARRRLRLPLDSFIVATAARLVASKGVSDVIQGMACIPDPERRLKLLVAGEGPERKALEILSQTCLGERVRFFGHLDDMTDFYAAADIFALASHGESFGLVYAEAAGYGRPSIGTDVGGIPETIQHGRTGLLVPTREPARLTAAIQFLWRDDLARQMMGQAARDRALAEFGERQMADRYLSILLPSER